MTINERITALRKVMQEEGISIYLIPSNDYHASEYVCDYFKAREFMSGFTGSAGTLVISHTEAILWTDGRYLIQAKKELEGSEIKLYATNFKDVPTIVEYLTKQLQSGDTLGFDGRLICAKEGNLYEKIFSKNNIKIKYQDDLINRIWSTREELPQASAYLLDIKYAGETSLVKINKVRAQLKKNQMSVNIITTLDDIAWLLNIRGDDILYSPLTLAYVYLDLKNVHLFIDQNKLNQELKIELEKVRIIYHDY
ncbi:aminopeptidase P family N-terminal domain-containing protein, partial [Erysipelotrichaceae bacterium OttesenSCG-928-M19]|nr:aminopeptidase P family N-terminal domain-containing protein [Erysipelotrichaceae bacterium OttesenSCG-928-M19]